MSKPELNKEDSEIYEEIIKQGDMKTMFEFGYTIGRVELAKEQLAILKEEL